MASRSELRALITLAGRIDPSLQTAMLRASNQSMRLSNNLRRSGAGISSLVRGAIAGVKSIAKVTAVAGTAIATGSILSAKVLTDQAASMEQYRNTLNVVMKDHEKAAKSFKWAVNFANQTPFETDEIVQATVKLSNYGLEAQKVLPLVGDMAGVMGKGLDQAVEAIADAQQGELERLKEFGITKQMIIDQANKVMRGKQIVNNKGQITDQKAFNLALFSLMKERYQGGMEIQAKSWKGLISTITGVWKTGLAQMAGMSDEGTIRQGSFFDIVKKRVAGLVDTLMRMQATGAFERAGQVLASATTTVFDAIEKYLPVVIKFGKQVIPVIGKVFHVIGESIGFLVSNWSVIEPILIGLATTLGMIGVKLLLIPKIMGFITLASTKLSAAIAFLGTPFGIAAVAIGVLVAAGWYLYKNWDTVSKFVVDVWQNHVIPFFSGIGEWFLGIWNGIVSGFKVAWSGITGWFSGLWEGIIHIFEGFINTYIKMFNFVIRSLNKIDIKVPDWVPVVGGKEFGINIPVLPTFEKGGIATGPSIFGEAGPEMAIPLKRSPRSLGLLQQTAQMLGVQYGGNNFIININVNTSQTSAQIVQQTTSALEEAVLEIIEKYFDNEERVQFDG